MSGKLVFLCQFYVNLGKVTLTTCTGILKALSHLLLFAFRTISNTNI